MDRESERFRRYLQAQAAKLTCGQLVDKVRTNMQHHGRQLQAIAGTFSS